MRLPLLQHTPPRDLAEGHPRLLCPVRRPLRPHASKPRLPPPPLAPASNAPTASASAASASAASAAAAAAAAPLAAASLRGEWRGERARRRRPRQARPQGGQRGATQPEQVHAVQVEVDLLTGERGGGCGRGGSPRGPPRSEGPRPALNLSAYPICDSYGCACGAWTGGWPGKESRRSVTDAAAAAPAAAAARGRGERGRPPRRPSCRGVERFVILPGRRRSGPPSTPLPTWSTPLACVSTSTTRKKGRACRRASR